MIDMPSEFGDVLERKEQGIPSVKSNPRPNRVETPPKETTSILELVEGMNLEEFSDKLNPEMKEKVIIPLANLLDKYGVSESLGESPTAQSTMGLMSLLGDVAPVIKGLAEYISGQRNSLREEDKAFLERIQEAQTDGEFSDLFVSESEPEAVASQVGPRGENLSAINIADAKVDWWEVMGVENPTKNNHGMMPSLSEAMFAQDEGAKLPNFSVGEDKPTLLGLESVEDMAENKGMAYTQVEDADTRFREVDEGTTVKKSMELVEEKVLTEENGEDIFSEGSLPVDEALNMDDFDISFESEE